jgi:hypothetical protein
VCFELKNNAAQLCVYTAKGGCKRTPEGRFVPYA